MKIWRENECRNGTDPQKPILLKVDVMCMNVTGDSHEIGCCWKRINKKI